MRNKSNRRKFVKGVIGTSSITSGLFIGSNGVLAENGRGRSRTKNEDQAGEDSIEDLLQKNYDRKTARVGARIIKNTQRKYSKGKYSEEEYRKQLITRLENNKHTAIIVQDYRNVKAEGQEIQQKGISNSDVSTQSRTIKKTSVSTQDASDSYYLLNWESSLNSGGAANADIDDDYTLPGDNSVNLEAQAAGVGSAWAEIEMSTSFTPDESGTWELKYEHESEGTIAGGGDALIEIFVDNDYKEVVSTIGTKPNQSATVTKNFTMSGGDTYDIGMRYYVSASGAAAVAISDFYDDNGFIAAAPYIEVNIT